MAEQYGTDPEGQTIQVGDGEYVVYLEDGQQLRNLLYTLCPIEMTVVRDNLTYSKGQKAEGGGQKVKG